MQNTPKFDLTTAPDSVLFDANLAASYNYMLEADCDIDCELNCTYTIPKSTRINLYNTFHKMTEVRIEQNFYLCTCIELKQRTVSKEDHIIEQTVEFWLGNEIKMRVCKTFFACTLGLPEIRLNALLVSETFKWFSKYNLTTVDHDGYNDNDQPHCYIKQPCTDFVLNSRKYLEKNHSAFVEETDSDTEVHLDAIHPSTYKNVINHIQTIPRIVNTWVNQENNQEIVKLECSINCHEMYLNYLKTSKKKKVNEKQYKKIYNNYVKKFFMV